MAELDRRKAHVGEELIAARTVVSDLDLEQTKAEADLEPVRGRLARNQQRIADGSVADPKALEGLVEEVAHLTRRISDLEDAELDVMQRLEDATTARDELAGAEQSVDGDLAEASTERDRAVGAVDAEIKAAEAERTEVRADIPDDLAALYERIRTGHGGVGAAALTRRRCTGCQLELNSADLRAYAAAAPEEVLRCEECNRILVRTEDSGL